MTTGRSRLPDECTDRQWSQCEPQYAALESMHLESHTLPQFLAGWTALSEQIVETRGQLQVAVELDPTDQAVCGRWRECTEELLPRSRRADQRLQNKLLASGLDSPGMSVPLRTARWRAPTEVTRNEPLEADEGRLCAQYRQLRDAQTVTWDGAQITPFLLQSTYRRKDRSRRHRAWRVEAERWLVDREAIDRIWRELLQVRHQMARNAGFDGFHEFRWRRLGRVDYTPQDCMRLHEAIEEFVQPVITRLYDRRRRRLGTRTVRPWDRVVDPRTGTPGPVRASIEELIHQTATVCDGIDPHLGELARMMHAESRLHLTRHHDRTPGGVCVDLPVSRRPIVVMNGTGQADDVIQLCSLLEHASQLLESYHWPYIQQREAPREFVWAAAGSIGLLAAQRLLTAENAVRDPRDSARAYIRYLEESLLCWPQVAIADSFEHWAYNNLDAAQDPAQCNAQWASLWLRFMPAVDWTDLDQELHADWHRCSELFLDPLEPIGSGVALLGAAQLWTGWQRDPHHASAGLRRALALGGTATLPELFAVAGAELTFDDYTLREVANHMEDTIDQLERG